MVDARAFFQENTGFSQILDRSVALYPDRTALVSGDLRLTYRELDEYSARFALVLRADGVRPGDPVAVISRNCAEFLVAEFAVWRLGAVVVKINWRFTPDEIQYLLELNRIHYVVGRYERRDWSHIIYERNKDKVKFYLFNPDPDGRSPFWKAVDAAPAPSQLERVEVDPGSVALRIHTSGTTGKPKCVLHSHERLLRQVRSCLAVLAFEPGTVYQVISQLFHISSIGSYLVLSTGGTVILMSRFEPKEYMAVLEQENCTGLGAIPVVLKRLLEHPELREHDLSGLRFVNYSTCPMPPALLKEATGRLTCDFYQSYGMTEMGSILTVLSPADHREPGGRHLHSVGRPIPGVRVRIVAEDGSDCPPGVTGEIVAQGPGQMLGYDQAPFAVANRALQGGWYHTGDMGYLDEEGYLFVQGRRDDLIISGGENIYPMEVANVIMRLTDDIQEVAVYGVPDEDWGERIKASAVLLPGSRLTQEALKAYCQANMSRYKVPKEIEFLPELPKNSTGKVLIQALKDRSARL